MFDIGIAIASAIYHIDRCSLFYRASEIVAGKSQCRSRRIESKSIFGLAIEFRQELASSARPKTGRKTTDGSHR